MQCSVSGCHAVFRRKDHEDHVYTAALSHMALQAGEVERLRRILYHNVSISWTISICTYVHCTDRLPLFNGEIYIKRFIFMNVHMSDFCFFLTQNYDKAPTITLKEGKTSSFRHNVSISWTISICIYAQCSDRLPLFNGERYIRRFIFMNVHMSDFCFFLTQNYDKAPTITLKEGKTSSFRWKVEQFSLYTDTVIAMLCLPWKIPVEGHLQLQAAAKPVTAKIRLGVLLFTCF